jgi:phosphoglycerol transferase MdoB-like AlkP superfamily enzyme
VRGLLQHNIEGLKIFEEGTYEDQRRTDVWGISDLDMFRYAAKELQKTQKPFFAFLQTAGFHRPYTIPKEHGSFEAKILDEDLLRSYGFGGNAEYNSIRFQDYALGEFFKTIENDDFYKNTIFFIYGDHGLSTRNARNTPQAMLDLDLVQHHSPLIVIGPGIKPNVDKKAASQADITATMAGLLGIGYKATAIGRDLFDAANERGAFILNSSAAPLRIGFIENGFYYTDWPNKKAMIKYEGGDSQTDWCREYPLQCERMKNLTRGIYEASRHITFNHRFLEK